MIRAECARCSYRVQVSTSTESRQAMLAHSAKVHAISIPGWHERDSRTGEHSAHGIAALQEISTR